MTILITIFDCSQYLEAIVIVYLLNELYEKGLNVQILEDGIVAEYLIGIKTIIVTLQIYIMADKHFCQSCSMPMDSFELFGTEKDGTINSDYCKYCYANGEFTSPGLTLEQMKEHMMKRMEKDKLPEDIIEIAISRLPFLKRWNNHITLS